MGGGDERSVKGKEGEGKAFDNKTNRCYTEINFSEVDLSIASKRG